MNVYKFIFLRLISRPLPLCCDSILYNTFFFLFGPDASDSPNGQLQSVMKWKLCFCKKMISNAKSLVFLKFHFIERKKWGVTFGIDSMLRYFCKPHSHVLYMPKWKKETANTKKVKTRKQKNRLNNSLHTKTDFISMSTVYMVTHNFYGTNVGERSVPLLRAHRARFFNK